MGEAHMVQGKECQTQGCVDRLRRRIGLTPTIRPTWAPVGKTPVLRTHLNWKPLHSGAICYFPQLDTVAIVF